MDRALVFKPGNRQIFNTGNRQTGAVTYFILFLVINAFKVTLFNFIMMNSHTTAAFAYKLVLTVSATAVVYFLLFKMRTPYALLTFYLLQTAYVFANICYFVYYHNYLHLFQSAALFSEGVGSVKHFSVPGDIRMLIVLLDLPLFVYVLFNYFGIKAFNENSPAFRRIFLAAPILFIVLMESWNYIHDYSIIQISRDYFAGEPAIVERYGTLANSFSDIIFNSGGKNLISHLQYGKTLTNMVEQQEKPNFIAIQVESMDANVINQQYNGSYIAPFLHSLSQESVYYPYVLSYHKAGGTSDSEYSIINSVEPLGNFPSIKILDYDYPNSMIRKLSDNSYKTLAFHGNVGAFYNRDEAFPKMGFQEFDDIKKMGLADEGWGAPDHEVFNYALKKLQAQTQPFFAYVITMTSHTPFTNARNYYNNSNYDTIQDDREKNYLNSISYVDQSIGNFVEEIQANFKNTYIFIWGDHTPDVNGDEYKQASFISDNTYFEFVPLIIITPDHMVYRENQRVASFLDISPTILNASGIQFTLESDGANLITPLEDFQKIPFKGGTYDRDDLFKKVSGESIP